MLKILQVRLQRYVKRELPKYKLDLEKIEEPEIKFPTAFGSYRNQGNSWKTFSLTTLKPLTMWITTNCKIFQEVRIPRSPYPALLWNLYAGQEATIRIGHGTTDWVKIGKGVRQGCILSSVCLTYRQSISCKMLESRFPEKISITSDKQMIPP